MQIDESLATSKTLVSERIFNNPDRRIVSDILKPREGFNMNSPTCQCGDVAMIDNPGGVK